MRNMYYYYEIIGHIFKTIVIAKQSHDRLRMSFSKRDLFFYIYLFSFWREKEREEKNIAKGRFHSCSFGMKNGRDFIFLWTRATFW